MKATRRIKTVEERFYPRLATQPNGCIEWIGATGRGGYGAVNTGPAFSEKRQWQAHRLAWTLANGPIPHGAHVCHKCDNPPCCNVDHLFLGTHAENMSDMTSKGRAAGSDWRSRISECVNGHPFTEANTYITPRGWRQCRSCVTARQQERRARMKS